MKIPTARFFLKDSNSKSETLIYFAYRIPGHSKRITLSSLQYCIPKYWDKATRRVKNSINYPIHKTINNELNKLATIATSIFTEFGGDISPEQFTEEMLYRTERKERPKDKEPVTLLSFIEKYILSEKSKPNSKRGTWKKYITIQGNLKEYNDTIENPLNFNSIDWEFKKKFESWMYSPPRSFSQNNVAKVFQVLSKFLKESHRAGHHKNEIFKDEDFKVRRTKVKDKIRLTDEEVKSVIKYDFSDKPHLDRVRDLFIAACYSGLRISDWSKIDRDHIRDNEGVLYLELMMQKTRKEVSIPVMDELLTILQKYDFQLPTMADQVFNRSIKKVLELAIPDSTYLRIYNSGGKTKEEILPKWEKASSHAGRRTFASNRYLEGWDIKKIQNILGHASQKQTEHYMDISDRELSIRTVRMMEYMKAVKTLRKV